MTNTRSRNRNRKLKNGKNSIILTIEEYRCLLNDGFVRRPSSDRFQDQTDEPGENLHELLKRSPYIGTSSDNYVLVNIVYQDDKEYYSQFDIVSVFSMDDRSSNLLNLPTTKTISEEWKNYITDVARDIKSKNTKLFFERIRPQISSYLDDDNFKELNWISNIGEGVKPLSSELAHENVSEYIDSKAYGLQVAYVLHKRILRPTCYFINEFVKNDQLSSLFDTLYRNEIQKFIKSLKEIDCKEEDGQLLTEAVLKQIKNFQDLFNKFCHTGLNILPFEYIAVLYHYGYLLQNDKYFNIDYLRLDIEYICRTYSDRYGAMILYLIGNAMPSTSFSKLFKNQ